MNNNSELNSSPENTTSSFEFDKFIQNPIKLLKDPVNFYSNLKLSGGMGEPIVNVLLYGLAAGVVGLIIGMLTFSKMPNGAGMIFSGGMGFVSIILSPIFSLIGLFVGAVFMLVLSAITGGSTDFESNARVSATYFSLAPISAALGIFNILTYYLTALASLAFSLYCCYLLYNALVNALKSKANGSKITAVVVGVLIGISTFGSMLAYRQVSKLDNFSKGFGKEFTDILEKNKGEIDRFGENAGKILEKINDEMEEKLAEE